MSKRKCHQICYHSDRVIFTPWKRGWKICQKTVKMISYSLTGSLRHSKLNLLIGFNRVSYLNWVEFHRQYLQLVVVVVFQCSPSYCAILRNTRIYSFLIKASLFFSMLLPKLNYALTHRTLHLTFLSLYCDMRNHQGRWRFLGWYSGTQFFTETLHTVAVFPRHEGDIATLLFTTEPNTKLHSDKLSQLLERSRVDSSSERYVLLYRALRAGFDGSRSTLGAIRWSYRSENSRRLPQIMTAIRAKMHPRK